MARQRRVIHFEANHQEAQFAEQLREELLALIRADDPNRWIGMSPWVDPENVPITSVLRRLFSARGSKIPEITVVFSGESKPVQVGVIHAAGSKALEALKESDVQVPEWVRPIQQHSRRGIVLEVPPAKELESKIDELIAFLIATGVFFAEKVGIETDERWVAQI